jgi:hypothetical protein
MDVHLIRLVIYSVNTRDYIAKDCRLRYKTCVNDPYSIGERGRGQTLSIILILIYLRAFRTGTVHSITIYTWGRGLGGRGGG